MTFIVVKFHKKKIVLTWRVMLRKLFACICRVGGHDKYISRAAKRRF